MVVFFYIYMLCVALELALTTNIIPISAALYKVGPQPSTVYAQLLVLCGAACRSHDLGLFDPLAEWLCGLSVGRGWDQSERLGTQDLSSRRPPKQCRPFGSPQWPRLP